MKYDKNSMKHIIADDGKGFYRKEDGSGPFTEVIFGQYPFKNGIRQETEEDFEERDIPEEDTEEMETLTEE